MGDKPKAEARSVDVDYLLPSPEVTAAMKALHDRASALRYTRPCISNPKKWDGARQEGERTDKAFEKRLVRAANACMDCAVFKECLALRQADPSIPGVMAGTVVLEPRVKATISQALIYQEKEAA